MTPSSPEGLSYSFSMINLVKLLPEWNWDGFDEVIAQAGTTRVELVPSMVLGVDWDQYITKQDGPVQEALEQLLQRCTVGSIQSLTYGLAINLADQLIDNPELHRRLQALRTLGRITECSVLILGSPGQKKQLDPAMSDDEYKQRFISNCSWMASTLGPELILSLEHNTSDQGAQYCNTLDEVADVVRTLRGNDTANVGLNLDTKCLIHEFGPSVHVGDLLTNPELAELITSIQVSFDFLTRDTPHRAEDQRQLYAFARARKLPLSLEEFGLLEHEVIPFVEAWNSQV
jgi:sugar phosphate isomerase/epimerase